VVAAAIGLTTAGCASGGSRVEKGELAKQVRTLMKQQTGKDYPVSCPTDLKAKVGAVEHCTWSATDGSTLDLTVTVQKVDGASAVTPAPGTTT
jgi:hypothetical protein